MKLATFVEKGNTRPKIGALTDDTIRIIVLETAAMAMNGVVPDFFFDMSAFLDGGKQALDTAYSVMEFALKQDPPGGVIPLDSVRLLSPVPRPESVRDCMAYEDHIINIIREVGFKKLSFIDEFIEKQFGREKSLAYRLNSAFYERPLYYKSNRFSVVGHDEDVIIPDYTQKMDYEMEFGIFIGKRGKDIPVKDARDYIGGYTIFNDFSARDIQLAEQKGRLGPAKGKDFDTGNAIGPWIVTPDEIGDPYNLEMTAKVNGNQWSIGHTSDMHWRFEDIIAYISKSETLYPGEFIGSGTCSGKQGRGCGLEMGKFLKKGDVVEIYAENIGVLRNRVV